MEPSEAVGLVEKSKEFKEWQNGNKGCFLSYVFTIMDSGAYTPWLVGYYDEKKDQITSFEINGGKVTLKPEEKAFKDPDARVFVLELKKVKAKVNEALDTVDKLQKEKYKAEAPVKVIVILQHLEEFGTVWNITYVSQTFKTLNVKVDAGTGKVAAEHLTSLFEFR